MSPRSGMLPYSFSSFPSSCWTQTHAHEVLHCPIGVVEAGAKSPLDLRPLETHLHHAVDGLLQCRTRDWHMSQRYSKGVESSLTEGSVA